MAEIKNTFLKSKMNKDLDDRLLPNGEYRDAQNISVGKSEDADVGALENIIGNANVTVDLPYSNDCEIIGYYVDKINNRVVTFVTNYTDLDPNNPSYVYDENNYNSGNYECHICVFNQNTNTYSKILTGDFLNFSTTNKVLGVNIIEEMLFFTDNRNQPRKISLDRALEAVSEGSEYYTSESQISVAKYNPYDSIKLIKKTTSVTSQASSSSNIITFSSFNNKIEVGMVVVAKNSDASVAIEGSDYVTVNTVSSTSPYEVTLKTQVGATTTLVDASVTIDAGGTVTFLKSTMTNQEDNVSWPGDPDLIEDKYIRFSYRFKFDDSEYSLIAPFTQIAYVPKQKGYFHSGDEDASYRSTIIEFMENEINNIELLIPLPCKGSNLNSEYKIQAIDILYKESDALSVKVLETIPVTDLNSEQTNIYNYEYQSRKPYKTLPQFQTTRVYDKVPVRALSQETSGNRVMYGNFYDQNTPPVNINYYVGAFDKNTNVSDDFIEYPNHTLKQNRNYQIGFVLADKFGRQSPVILSPVNSQGTEANGNFSGGSTIYHQYRSSGATNTRDWFGDQIQLVINETSNGLGIDSNKNLSQGTPGLYAIRVKDPNFSGIGFSINFASFDSPNQDELEFTLDSTNNPNNGSVPRVGDYLRGEFKDYVKVTNVVENAGTYTVTADGSISSKYLYNSSLDNDIKFAYTINQTGWYSYKVVVKQTEQEYYNCYLPGILNGYPTATSGTPFPNNEDNLTAHVVLLNDNINKIPRDLSEVGPDQKQYRSSVRLFGRVQNVRDAAPPNDQYNAQYYPGRSTDTASTIATASDLNMAASDITSDDNFYQLDTNPLIARISTLSGAIGVTSGDMNPILAVYETEPVNSLLDIFWETSTAGLISDLNEDVSTGSEGAIGVSNPNFLYNEFQNPSGDIAEDTGTVDSPWITDFFSILTAEGTPILTTGLRSQSYIDDPTNVPAPYIQVTNNASTPLDVSSSFVLYQETDPLDPNLGKYRVRLSGQTSELDNLSYWGSNSLQNNQYTFVLNSVQDVYDGATLTGYDSVQFSLSQEGELLSLTNNNPYLLNSLNGTPSSLQLPLLEYEQGQDVFSNGLLVKSNGAHWTFTPTNWYNDSGVFFTQIPPKPLSIAPENFLINHTSGAVTTNYDLSIGYYTWKIKVKDTLSYFASGNQNINSQGSTPAGGGQLLSDEYEKTVRIVPKQISSDLKTSCLFTYDPNNPDDRQFEAEIETASDPDGGLTNRTFGWYIAGSELAISDMPVTTWPYGDPVRLGTAGFTEAYTEIQLDLMVEVQRKTYAIAAPAANAYYEWTIYKRSNSGGTWSKTSVKDSNNTNISDDLNDVDQVLSTANTDNSTSSSNFPIAFNTPNQYFITCKIKTRADQFDDNTARYAACWVNVNDANYPTCVPLYGTNMAAGSGRDADYFGYIVQRVTNINTPESACDITVGTEEYFARTPYAHMVREFFEDTTFDNAPAQTFPSNSYNNYIYEPSSSGNKDTLKLRFAVKFTNYIQTFTTSTTAVDTDGYKTREAFTTSYRTMCGSTSNLVKYEFIDY